MDLFFDFWNILRQSIFNIDFSSILVYISFIHSFIECSRIIRLQLENCLWFRKPSVQQKCIKIWSSFRISIFFLFFMLMNKCWRCGNILYMNLTLGSQISVLLFLNMWTLLLNKQRIINNSQITEIDLSMTGLVEN